MKKYNKLMAFFIKSRHIFREIIVFVLFILSIFNGWIVIFYSFIIFSFIYIINILKRKLPLDVEYKGEKKTYTYKENLKLDIWYPENINEIHPVILFSHGGGWISGFRNQPNNVSWCKYLASNGFAVVSIDYRFGFKNSMKEILKDYTDSLEFLKTNANKLKLDKRNIVLMGLSAGGHLAMLYAAHNSYIKDKEKMAGIKGVVSYYTPADLNDLFEKNVKSLFSKFAVTTTLKGSPQKIKGEYIYYSPISWINCNMVPVLLVHGKEDDVVPFESMLKVVKKLKEKNIKHEVLVHKNGGHTFEFYMNDYHTVKIVKKTVAFIRACFKDEN
ncbi:esterase [Tepiditoga spiralis]|uniref:Esterase n=1 Tax=Tepiditoga spiralis TaxID=2108365 RepID=A0A7G1G9N7_9BACT|nr:alpha/beta fold hydrolase [Tepiditoga spiralis]BBE30782.1 esterase [Tepiditoga spiralis]